MSASESDDENYFAFSATLRIMGDALDFEAIEQATGLRPTHTHRKGERRSAVARPYRHDAWHYAPDVDEAAPLADHIDALWAAVSGAQEFLIEMKTKATLSVFCGYRSNCDSAGFQVPPRSLEMFVALQIPFGVSVIIA
ncbi:MAG: DUF4279 domain-containing protein [Pseudomonadota bacterium]